MGLSTIKTEDTEVITNTDYFSVSIKETPDGIKIEVWVKDGLQVDERNYTNWDKTGAYEAPQPK